ncbi:hypothetical protein [Paraburkholderia nemoris]|uniref:hypothetical protein n=1 Tax=Paraburkholderia nemoris TaxID=2793076 RepID=UPI00190D6CE4|nr:MULTISPECIES: hypothetical protein [Paraburkholderia]MBK3812825.1 hypothetical protein [Paraburkholderia aspalathi]
MPSFDLPSLQTLSFSISKGRVGCAHRKDLRERLASALETAVEAVLDALAGRNGFQATEDGEI